MGVDVTVFLGRLDPAQLDGEPGRYFRIDAMANLRADGYPLAERLAAYRNSTPVYFYPPIGGGEKRICEDSYGTRLVAVPIAALGDEIERLLAGARMHAESHLALPHAMVAAAPPWVTHAVVWCS